VSYIESLNGDDKQFIAYNFVDEGERNPLVAKRDASFLSTISYEEFQVIKNFNQSTLDILSQNPNKAQIIIQSYIFESDTQREISYISDNNPEKQEIQKLLEEITPENPNLYDLMMQIQEILERLKDKITINKRVLGE